MIPCILALVCFNLIPLLVLTIEVSPSEEKDDEWNDHGYYDPDDGKHLLDNREPVELIRTLLILFGAGTSLRRLCDRRLQGGSVTDCSIDIRSLAFSGLIVMKGVAYAEHS